MSALIEPYGIEILFQLISKLGSILALIEPYGIEILLKKPSRKLLSSALIEPYGIEMSASSAWIFFSFLL